MPKIKVCGITNAEDALLACNLGADALGFIFYEKSHRYISPADAKEISETLPPFVATVGVFVNAQVEFVNKVCADVSLHLAQLHGDESPQYCAGLRTDFIKVFRVGETFDSDSMALYPEAKGYLLDTYRKGAYGGTGETFDWSVAQEAKKHGRIILSGGLSLENVSESIAIVGPYAVDVCSGVEAFPGKKDPEKLQQFIEEVQKGLERKLQCSR